MVVSSSTDRAVANRIALAAIRAILDGATPFALTAEGRHVRVEVDRVAPPQAPSQPLIGLNLSENNALPSGVRLRCSWEGGQVVLVARLGWWPPKGTNSDLVGLRVAIESTNQEIVWTTVAIPATDRRDGDVVDVLVSFSLFTRKGEEADETARLGPALKAAITRSGLPLASEWRVKAFSMTIPTG